MSDRNPPVRPASRIAGFEGLRALAAGSIVLLHACSILAGARLITVPEVLFAPLIYGVTLFFVLSGFLLWRPVALAIATAGPLPSVRRYARNRALRILPAYWVILALTALVLGSARLVPVAPQPLAGMLHDPRLLLDDALLVQGLSPSTLASGIEPAWSLSVEATFYLLVPVLALLAARLARRASGRRPRLLASLAPAAVLVAIAIAGKLVAWLALPGTEGAFSPTWHAVVDRSFATHADLFAVGMLVAVIHAEHAQGRFALSERLRSLTGVLTVNALPLIYLTWIVAPPYLGEPLVALLFGAIVLRVVTGQGRAVPSRLVLALERRPLVGLGIVSYSAFLWSGPATTFIAAHRLVPSGSSPWHVPVDVAIVAATVAILATGTYLAVERPALRFRGRTRRAAATAPALARS
jgi:peptidoglycan/LPS O-acetylase OafA/YrhL